MGGEDTLTSPPPLLLPTNTSRKRLSAGGEFREDKGLESSLKPSISAPKLSERGFKVECPRSGAHAGGPGEGVGEAGDFGLDGGGRDGVEEEGWRICGIVMGEAVV